MTPPTGPTTQNRISPSDAERKIQDASSNLLSILKKARWAARAPTEVAVFTKTIHKVNGLRVSTDDPSAVTGDYQETMAQLVGELERTQGELNAVTEKYDSLKERLGRGLKKKSPPDECIKLLADCQNRIRSHLTKIDTEIGTSGDGGSTQRPLPPTTPKASEGSSWREKWLGSVKTVCKTADAASGAIPLAGNFIGMAAKVGLVVIEVVETLDQNDESAKLLKGHIDSLSGALEYVTTGQPTEQTANDRTVKAVRDLQFELGVIHNEIKKLQSRTTSGKVLFYDKDAGALKTLQQKTQLALGEFQLISAIDTSAILNQLSHGINVNETSKLLKCLGDGYYGARGNLGEDVTCFPETRVEVLNRIDEWITASSPTEKVFWLCGMAGRGKSTIASTVAAHWKDRAVCAIFHFRRDEILLQKQVIISLAKQIAKSVDPDLQTAILASVRDDEDISNKRLEEQFKALLITPLKATRSRGSPILIIIDALDECGTAKYAIDLVNLLKRNLSSFSNNVKFLLTSRPELPLVRELQPMQWPKESLDENVEQVSFDIHRYLAHGLAEIKAARHLRDDWATARNVHELVRMSQGLFQWARTILSYVREGHPPSRLKKILQSPDQWDGVDHLYSNILTNAIQKFKPKGREECFFQNVLGTIVSTANPVSLEVLAFLHVKEDLISGMDGQEAAIFLKEEILADLSSLLFLPQVTTDPVTLMHTSIRDLLVDRERSINNTSYWIDLPAHHRRLAGSCLQRMNQHLRQDITNLRDIFHPVSKIGDVAQRSISAGLQYCCRSWSIHLVNGWTESDPPAEGWKDLAGALRTFSETKALFWLEVMSLMGWLREAITIAKQAESWFSVMSNQSPDGSVLCTLWDDVHRFINAFWEPIACNPMQIYVSALAHCPQRTVIWERYRLLAKVVTLPETPSCGWPSEQWARSVGCAVTAVAYSPDGSIIATGDYDGMIRMLDAQTGAQVGEPLTGHGGQVSSVSFSPDGKLVASGSVDKTVRLWDTQTGAHVGEPLTGHGDEVFSVSFSADGKLLASGSNDRTVRLWDTRTGEQVGEPLTGHGDGVFSVSFSSDAKLLASGSHDKTVRLWDTRTGEQVGEPLTGHGDGVNSVSFSPDGKLVASGSRDRTVRLWDPQTRKQVGEPLTGHGYSVTSVSFSLDGKLVASGSGDSTVRLWDTRTGKQVGGSLRGHGEWVRSVSFSPKGNLVASGSYDNTVRLWVAQASQQARKPLIGHGGQVSSVSFSPDGKLVASGSYDNTVRLWDTRTGEQVGEPLTGHDNVVTSVSFSPDGKLMASGSWDATIRLWDTRTGKQVGDPFTGHGDKVTAVSFSPNGKLLASRSYDKTVRLWDPQTGGQVGEPLGDDTPRNDRGHPAPITFSFSGDVITAPYYSGPGCSWNVHTYQKVSRPSDLISSIEFPLRGRWFNVGPSRALWFPAKYWKGDVQFHGASGMLVVRCGSNLAFFNISRALDAFSLR